MYAWTLAQFESPMGRKAIDDWRKKLTPARRAVMDTFLDRMAKMEFWPSGLCDPIRGHLGCWELRWTAEKVEHRICGCFAENKRFVMLIGCTHKGRVYNPREALATMDERKADLRAGRAKTREYYIWPT